MVPARVEKTATVLSGFMMARMEVMARKPNCRVERCKTPPPEYYENSGPEPYNFFRCCGFEQQYSLRDDTASLPLSNAVIFISICLGRHGPVGNYREVHELRTLRGEQDKGNFIQQWYAAHYL
jgi:hypothetical protein